MPMSVTHPHSVTLQNMARGKSHRAAGAKRRADAAIKTSKVVAIFRRGPL